MPYFLQITGGEGISGKMICVLKAIAGIAMRIKSIKKLHNCTLLQKSERLHQVSSNVSEMLVTAFVEL